MRALIVHAHLNPNSFNAALTARAAAQLTRAGHQVETSDLYAMGPEAVASLRDFPRQAPADRATRFQDAQFAALGIEAGLRLDIGQEQRKVERADAVILQFPLWWLSMPAIPKGGADRVMTRGWAYGGQHGICDRAALRGRRALISMTTGGPAPTRRRPD